MNIYAIYFISIAGWIIARRGMHQDDVCKYLAICFHGEEDKVLIKSTVGALTDPKQDIWVYLGSVLIVLSIYLKWSSNGALSSFVMVGISMFIAIIYRLFVLPKTSEPKCMADVLKSLYRRKTKFEKEHDVMRAHAIDFYIKKIEDKFKEDLSNAANLYAKSHKEIKSTVSNNEIIGAFVKFIQNEDFDMSAIYDVKELTYSKADTLRAISEEIRNTTDTKMKGLFETGLFLACRFFEDIGQPLVQDHKSYIEMAKLYKNVNAVEDLPKNLDEKLIEIYKTQKPFDREKHDKYSKRAIEDFNKIAENIGISKIDNGLNATPIS